MTRRAPRPSPRRIAVVRLLRGVGDLLCAVPALRALRAAEPDAEITWIAAPGTGWLLERFPHYLDGRLDCPAWPGLPELDDDPHAAVRFLVRAQWRRFDVAAQLHGNGTVTNGLAALLGARTVVGLHPPGAPPGLAGQFTEDPGDLHEIHRLLLALRPLGVEGADDRLELPLEPGERRAAERLLAVADGRAARRYAVVHAGASVDERRWAPEGFARVADGLAAGGRRVVLTGGPAEVELAEIVRRAMTAPATSLAGRTDIGTLAAVVAGAELVVCNDTGISHVAAAVGTPSVVVYGAGDVGRWAPLDRARHRRVERAGRREGDVVAAVLDAAGQLAAVGAAR